MFEINVGNVQSLLDEGNSMTGVANLLGLHHQTLRRFIDKHGIEVYEPFDEVVYSIPMDAVERCVYINEDYRVVFDEDELSSISTQCGRSASVLKSSVKEYVAQVELDAIGEFVESLEFDEVNNEAITKHRHILAYIYKHCGGLIKFREMFGVDFDLVSYTSDGARSWYASKGHVFEGLVDKCLRQIHGDSVDSEFYIKGCLPDFVIGDKWIDAKLSKSTAFSRSCDTIEKYSQHTDKLSIIYCIEDVDEIPSQYDHIDFVHITELYPYISDELMADISELKAEVQRRKRGERS